MKIKEAYDILQNRVVGRRFGEILPYEDLIHNKGRVGQLIEKFLEISPGNSTLDFEDGELKTFKSKIKGYYIEEDIDEILEEEYEISPMETLAITQISSNNIDEYLSTSFVYTNLYKKIRKVLFVPVVKEGDIRNWYIPKVKLENPISDYGKELEEDFNDIIYEIKGNRKLKTITGRNKYLQIRSKDSKPYQGVISSTMGELSNKRYAFYFKKEFIRKIF